MITLVLWLALVGFVVWLIITYIPMPDIFKKVIPGIVAVLIILYLIQLFGIDFPIPRVRH